MREMSPNLAMPKSAQNLAKYGRPPPLAVVPMLGSDWRPGQADAVRELRL